MIPKQERSVRMKEQINGPVGLAALEATPVLGWQALAIGVYEWSWPDRLADLRTALSTRILELTGRHIPPEEVYTDGHLAVAGVDDVTFRLYHGTNFVLVRACAYCGTGHFESPHITDLSDLGYALSAWMPLHEDCGHYSEDFPEF
jgi:hypothetical protein